MSEDLDLVSPLLDPVSGEPMIPQIALPRISRMKTFAERLRAALSRRKVAGVTPYQRIGLRTAQRTD